MRSRALLLLLFMIIQFTMKTILSTCSFMIHVYSPRDCGIRKEIKKLVQSKFSVCARAHVI